MDMSLVMAAMTAKAGALQTQIANSVLKSNLDSQKSSVLTLLGAGQQAPSLGNVGPGVGGNLNIAA
jgi:Putative motility protein